MNDTFERPTHEELVARLPESGWHITNGRSPHPTKTKNLMHALQINHETYKKGEEPGLITHLETGLELEALEMQQLWTHLGLPT